MTNPSSETGSKKIAAGICGILLGALGVHKFILGYTQEGLIMILVTLVGGIVTCGIASFVMGVIGLVEGIIYLTKTDSEFDAMYVAGKKGWF
jgi:TM2 domain-containing membrane protein YozV